MSVTILAGYSAAAVASCDAMFPPHSVIVVEHPEIVEKRKLFDAVANARSIDQLVAIDHTTDGAADQFAGYLSGVSVASVMPITDYATVFAARLAERVGLPSASLGAARILRRKDVLRQVTRAHGIPNPASRVVSDLAEARAVAKEFGFPVVVKPSGRQASVGASIVTQSEQLSLALQHAQSGEEGIYAPQTVADSRILVEEYLDGPEYSVEAIVQNRSMVFVNVTEKILTSGLHPVESGHIVPARIDPALRNKLTTLTRDVISAVGFECGIVHCEWKIGGADRQPRLIECAGRFAGDGIIELIERAYEFDIVDVVHRLMRGDSIGPLPATATGGAAVRFITPVEHWGVVQDVTIEEDALRGDSQVLHWHTATQPGDTVHPVLSSWDRHGSVTVIAAHSDDAAAAAARSIQAIRITTDKGLLPCL